MTKALDKRGAAARGKARAKQAAKEQPYILLRAADGHKQVKIETEQEDRFLLTVEAAIQACKAFDKLAVFHGQFRKLVDHLAAWTKEHTADVKLAYLTVRDAGLLFLVGTKTKRFNQELEDSLTDLDIEVAQDEQFDLIKMSVLALPDSSDDCVKSFLGNRAARED